ncbi:MAG: glycine cleavage system protein GcvH [Firmicutes bacterium]|nr:glycine cleavage system protein GcvH [Bacillota bacterium]
MYPEDLKYSETHEWVEVENGTAKIGITFYAQEKLGDIVFVELPQVGDEFSREDVFGVVESVKAVSDLYMPVDGRVISVNEQLEETPEVLNSDPYNEGWIIEIEIKDPKQLQELKDAKEYEESLDTE